LLQRQLRHFKTEALNLKKINTENENIIQNNQEIHNLALEDLRDQLHQMQKIYDEK
jgi:hypothetical protein